MPAAEPEAVIDGFKTGTERLKAAGLQVIAGTLPPALGCERLLYGSEDVDRRRRQVNEFIRSTNIFDGVVDFEGAVTDPATGAIRQDFQPDSTIGDPGDALHPNRAGYQAMAAALDLSLFRS